MSSISRHPRRLALAGLAGLLVALSAPAPTAEAQQPAMPAGAIEQAAAPLEGRYLVLRGRGVGVGDRPGGR